MRRRSSRLSAAQQEKVRRVHPIRDRPRAPPRPRPTVADGRSTTSASPGHGPHGNQASSRILLHTRLPTPTGCFYHSKRHTGSPVCQERAEPSRTNRPASLSASIWTCIAFFSDRAQLETLRRDHRRGGARILLRGQRDVLDPGAVATLPERHPRFLGRHRPRRSRTRQTLKDAASGTRNRVGDPSHHARLPGQPADRRHHLTGRRNGLNDCAKREWEEDGMGSLAGQFSVSRVQVEGKPFRGNAQSGAQAGKGRGTGWGGSR